MYQEDKRVSQEQYMRSKISNTCFPFIYLQNKQRDKVLMKIVQN
jgi:hypothetical protein